MKYRPGDYIRIIETGVDYYNDAYKNKIYKMIKTLDCVYHQGCIKECKSNFKSIIICRNGDPYRIMGTCGWETELYVGPDENTLCYACKDKLMCTVNLWMLK